MSKIKFMLFGFLSILLIFIVAILFYLKDTPNSEVANLINPKGKLVEQITHKGGFGDSIKVMDQNYKVFNRGEQQIVYEDRTIFIVPLKDRVAEVDYIFEYSPKPVKEVEEIALAMIPTDSKKMKEEYNGDKTKRLDYYKSSLLANVFVGEKLKGEFMVVYDLNSQDRDTVKAMSILRGHTY